MPSIDQNSRQVGLGLVHGTANMVLPFRINPANQKLQIEVIPVGSIGTYTTTRNLPIDENSHQIAGAVTDDANQDIIPITADAIVGFPCIRVEGTFI